MNEGAGTTPYAPILEPVSMAGLTLRNRAVVAPMSRVSTNGDGVATTAMADYYAAFADGGFGLVVTEGTYTDHAHSQAYANQPAIVTDAQVRAWARVVDAVHAAGGRIFLQLMHAGALVQGNAHRAEAVAPSAVEPKGEMLSRGYGGEGPYRMPRTMTLADIREAVAGFAAAARHACTAGFDGIEIHGANGYLLDQFLTPYTNRRTDGYGGGVEQRLRIFAETVEAIRTATGDDFPVGIRVSQVKVNDAEHRWKGQEEAVAIFTRLGELGPAYVHVSSEDDVWETVSWLAPGVSITGVARAAAGVLVIANGGLHDPGLATRLICDGHADLVSLGKGALANPDWPRRLAAGRALEPYERDMLWPTVTLADAARWRARRDSVAA